MKVVKQSSDVVAEIFWSDDGDLRAPVLRDAEGRCIQPFTHYLDSQIAALRKSGKSGSAARASIEPMIYTLRGFVIYLMLTTTPLWRVDDDVLLAYRNWARREVASNPRSRGLPHQIVDTVNAKLRQVYEFICWCQLNRRLPADTMGWLECKIRSTLPQVHQNPLSDAAHRQANKYPLMLTGGSESSRVREGQHWATPEELEQLEDLFWTNQSIQCAERNCTMLRVLEMESWRIGSANSLLVSQFSDEAFEKYASHDHFMVCPPGQKRGYTKTFEMPWELAHRIKRYIEDDEAGRASILKKLEVDERVAKGRIFLSQREGKPLTTSAWLRIFGDAYRELGVDKGAGTHSIRRYGAEKAAAEYLDYLHANNIPATKEIVIAHLMETLGHTSDESYAAYIRVVRLRRSRSAVATLDKQLKKATLKNDELLKRIATTEQANQDLQRLVAELQSKVKNLARRVNRTASKQTPIAA